MFRMLVPVALMGFFATTVFAHCQVPCGIYGDQLRFEQMLEDEHTISKAQITLNEMMESENDAQAAN